MTIPARRGIKKGLTLKIFPFFKKPEPKKVYNLPDEVKNSVQHQKTLGYLNPFWKIRFTHKGKEIISIPFSILVCDFLKNQGFDPEGKINPSIKIELDIGMGQPVSCPLFVQDKCSFHDNITIEEALAKGMIYKSAQRK